MTWIQTYSRLRFELTDPQPGMVAIEDIAHALSQIPRFTGHCRRAYSIAQHSVFVANAVGADWGLEALLHDAAEAYIGDISQPLKMILGQCLERIENRIRDAIWERFDLRYNLPHKIKAADLLALSTEAHHLLDGELAGWSWPGGRPNPLPELGEPWSADLAEHRFLMTFHALYDDRGSRTFRHGIADHPKDLAVYSPGPMP